MITSHFGFREAPFQFVKDPDYVFRSRAFTDAYEAAQAAVRRARLVTLICGKRGSGTSVLLHTLCRTGFAKAHCAALDVSGLWAGEGFIGLACHALGVGDRDGQTPGHALRIALGQYHARGVPVIFAIDEAHEQLIEDLRKLIGVLRYEEAHRPLAQLLLAGSLDSAARLQSGARFDRKSFAWTARAR